MIPTNTQRKNTLARWRKILAGLVILLLCVPPGEAAIICHCPLAAEARQACHQTAAPTANEQHEQASETAASHCQTARSSATPVRESSQHAMKCCEEIPLGEWQNAELSSATTVVVEEQPSLASHDQHGKLTAPPYLKHHPRQPRRPLYLTFSCWLI